MNLRRTVHAIIAWWHRRRVVRSAPQLAEIEREIEAHRRKHRPVRRLLRAKSEIVHDRLAKEQGRRITVSVTARGK